MSMIGNFRVSTDEEVADLLADPGKIHGVLYPEDGSTFDDEVDFDVDKAWHAIHFLLCGHPWEGNPPLDFLVSGGTTVGDVDVGYGPARVFTSMEVSEIVRAMEPITSVELRTRFNASTFMKNDIYPGIWDEPESECLDGYVLDYFNRLKEFLRRICDGGKALIVYTN